MTVSWPAKTLDPFTEARRASIILLLPVASGAILPWAVWATAGWIDANGLAVASFVLAIMYMQGIWWLGDREAELRRQFGRRYSPPSADLALLVCAGLAVCMIAPGLSAVALTELVGMPRASGVVQEYDPLTLGEAGATIDLSRSIPGHAAMDIIPGGFARVTVPRFGSPAAFAMPLNATGAEFCFGPSQCLTVDRNSGRVRARDSEVGRVTAVGGVSGSVAAQEGAPWEISNLFR